MTDFKSHDQWLIGADYTDFFFVSNTEMQKKLVEKNINENKVIVTGIPVREEFLINHNKDQILKDLDFSKDKKTILFFGGGEFGLGKQITFNVFECLLKKCSNIQIIAII